MRDETIIYLLEPDPELRLRRAFGAGVSACAHFVAMAAVIVMTAQAVNRHHAQGGLPKSPVIITVSPNAIATSQPDRSSKSVRDDLGIHIDDQQTAIVMPGFAFDFSKVIRRSASLFPFLTGAPGLEAILKEPSSQTSGRLRNPLQRPRRSSNGPPLQMSDGVMQQILDAAWSRRDRWRLIGPIASLLDRYDPDAGRLPELVRSYVEQDGLQPYVDTTIRDPRLWVQLGLVADHADFVDLIVRFARKHPSTKTTTELLFLLDGVIRASRDALLTLVHTDPGRDLFWTRSSNPAAYRALIGIRSYYVVRLKEHGLTTDAAIQSFYGEMRLAELQHIRDSTPRGYRLSDATFLMGEIYWREGRFELAAQTWRALAPAATDIYSKDATALLALIAGAADPTTHRVAFDIGQVLADEEHRWESFSFDRLRHFGYRFDTF